MATEKVFIRVMKLMGGKPHKMAPDNIDVNDIKSFRNFLIDPGFTDYTGDCCQVSILSKKDKDGFYTIQIAESEESFGARLGRVIPLSDGGRAN